MSADSKPNTDVGETLEVLRAVANDSITFGLTARILGANVRQGSFVPQGKRESQNSVAKADKASIGGNGTTK